MRAGGEIEADQVADEVRLLDALRAGESDDPLLQLAPRQGGRVAFLDLEARCERVADEGIGQLAQLLARSSIEQPDMPRQQIDPVGEFVEQARLAYPGLADDRTGPQ